MDSYALHFERMSNVDLHPLSLPVSRLSPAKSNSSIVDQLAHHQHGKGDSAYSSFSGGSTAPDYPSPFLPDELQSSSFSQYADLKYVKSIYHPTHVLHSDSKTMDQLYRSVKAISQQYRNNAGIKVNHNNHNANEAFYSNNLKQEVSLTKGAYHNPIRPPPIPTRLDSYIATKNLENSRIHQHSTEIQQSQQQPRSNNRLHSLERDLNVSRPEMVLSNKGTLNLSSDPVYSVWRGSQQQQGAQQSPSCQPPDQTRTTSNPEHLFITDNNSVHDQQKSTNVLSRSPPRSTIHQEHRRPSTNGDHHKKPNAGTSQFERQRKRAYSANEWLGSETTWAPSPWKSGQSVFNSSIQHKGQFYFVTGVCKGSGSGTRSHSTSSCVSEAGSNISTVPETYQLREKERCHSTLDNLFGPLQQTSRSSSGTVPDECETFTSLSQGNDMTLCSQDQENCRLSSNSVQSSQSFDTSEEIDMQTRDSGRHTACNPIFYCGPDRTSPPHSSMETQELPALISTEQTYDHKKLNQVKKGTRQPLGDVVSERINKETTPLLYHLTGASRAPLQPKNKPNVSLKSKEPTLHKTIHGNLSDNERPIKSDTSKNDGGEISACNTLDDSFKKYYKEKLKDAQSKVLRETSFKRRDLQLSWPHRVRQKPRAIHSFSSSQDSETSTDTLTPSLISEETETGNVEEDWRENWMEMDKETEKQNVSPVYVAQSQRSRIGGKKRLTPEQKKMCYSEPEKLNQLGGTPVHSSCRSFGNESESLFCVECEEDEGLQQGEQGLVASRCKMFESRGQAFSATGASKTNLKHLQHKALVEYMERKTGQKVAEPQQPGTQVPPPSRQRHSLGEKPFDWGHRQLSGNNDGKNTKKKLQRPHSAGRILDSPSSSVRYAQFFSAQSCSGQYALQANQPGRRESKGRSQGKCASVESLLDQPEPPSFLRNRSASTPQTLEDLKACDSEKNSLPVKSTETTSLQKKPAKNSLAAAAEGQQRFRVVAQRGKSMEELAASKLTRLSALSRSSEQLDQFRRSSTGPGGQDREKYVSFFDEIREAHGEDRDRKKEYLRKQSAKEPDQKTTLGQTQNQTEKKSLLKQHSESGEDPIVGTRNSSRPTSPTSTSSRTRVHSRSHGSDMLTSTQPPSETLSTPPSPSNLETSEKELKSASSSPTQTKHTCEMGPCSSRDRTSSVAGLEREQSVNEPVSEPLLPDSNHEVSPGSGVTTDPAFWILPPEEEIREEVQTSPLVDDVFDDESTTLTAAAPTRRPSVSPCPSVSIKDQQGEDENIPETEGERSTENLEMEERGTPEDQTASVQKSSQRPQWEELVEAVVAADPSLIRTLYPLANRKTALMLMEQLLSEDTLLMEEHYKKKEELKEATESTEMAKVTEPCTYPSAPDSPKPQCSDLESKTDITEKKCLLVSHIEGRLRALEEMRSPLQAEIEQNAAHGEALALLVRDHCLPVELERYNLFIGDLERVVNLLLCLSARLARVQNALSTVDHHTDAEEKQSLDSRHRLLCKQREDAKDLKDNLDRRENMVSTFLSRQLSAEQLQDYRHFVQTKASLLIRQKDLEEKQRLGEEQLEALSNSLNL